MNFFARITCCLFIKSVDDSEKRTKVEETNEMMETRDLAFKLSWKKNQLFNIIEKNNPVTDLAIPPRNNT